MKKILAILLLIMITAGYADILSFRLAPKFINHIKNFDEHDPPDDIPVPSMGFFFDASFTVGAEMRYFFLNNETDIISPIFLDLTYDYYTMKPDKRDFYLFFGEKLYIHQIGITIGHNLLVDFLTTDNIQPYLLAGYVYKNYHGRLDDYIAWDNGLEFDYKQFYKKGHSARFGFGFHFMNKNNIFKSIQLNIDTGNITRDIVEVYDNDEYIGKYEPVGDKIIPDINLSLYFTIGYDFIWGGNK